MPKKRLENALNAGKLIQLGFGLNDAKPEKLNLLYTVNCVKHQVTFINQNITTKSKSPNDSDYDSDQESEPKTTSISDDGEKIEILSLQFNENQNILATGDSNGEIQMYDVFSANPLSTDEETSQKKSKFSTYFSKSNKIFQSSVYNMPIICMKWHPYSNFSCNFLYYAHVNGFIGVCDKETLSKAILVREKDEISCIDFCPDGSVLASVGKDYTVKLYDSNLNSSADLKKIIKTYGNNPADQGSILNNISNKLSSLLSSNSGSSSHTNRLQCVKFSNTSNDLLFTGGWDRSVKAWDKRTSNGFVNTLPGPFVCGSDAIDVNDNLVLTASWVKENALELWDIRKFKKVSVLPIAQKDNNEDDPNVDKTSISYKLRLRDSLVNEYLYACKFFSSSNHLNFESDDKKFDLKNHNSKLVKNNYSTVLACGSGTQSLHLLDYEEPEGKQLISSYNCASPLYCLDAIYSCSLIACGGMKNFFTLMGTSNNKIQ